MQATAYMNQYQQAVPPLQAQQEMVQEVGQAAYTGSNRRPRTPRRRAWVASSPGWSSAWPEHRSSTPAGAGATLLHSQADTGDRQARPCNGSTSSPSYCKNLTQPT